MKELTRAIKFASVATLGISLVFLLLLGPIAVFYYLTPVLVSIGIPIGFFLLFMIMWLLGTDDVIEKINDWIMK